MLFMSMFSKRPEQPMPSDFSAPSTGRPAATVIAHGVRVEGDFSSQGDVVIEGEVHGNVSVSGILSVGPQARLKAGVSAEKAMISGVIEGNVTVTGHLEIKSTAQIIGDVQSETASVESGATLNGKVMIGAKSRQATIPSVAEIAMPPESGRGRNQRGDKTKEVE